MVPVDGRMTAVDPEVIAIVPTGAHGGSLAAASLVPGRRPHAGLCESYQRESRREKTRKEMRAFSKRTRKGGL